SGNSVTNVVIYSFQAEDGIRDFHVTGVQTCALPISGLLVVVLGADLLQGLGGTEQGDAAARQDAFLDRSAGGMHRVIDAILALRSEERRVGKERRAWVHPDQQQKTLKAAESLSPNDE